MRALLHRYFSFSGRLSHGSFLKLWLTLVITELAVIVAAAFLVIHGFSMAGYLAAVIILVLVLSVYAIFIRRLHDRGFSGWLLIISAAIGAFAHVAEKSSPVPVLLVLVALGLAQIWLLIEVLFIRGKVGPNRYGPDPLA